MPVVDKNQLKIWFKNLAKPVQEQFWNWMDSFYHKSEPIPKTAVENLTTDLAKKADLVGGVVPASQLPFSVNTSEVIAVGEISATENTVTLAVHSSGTNAVRINGVVLTRSFPNTFNFTPVTDGSKFLILYAINESGIFRLAEGVEDLEAVEPELPAGALFVRRILINSAGADVELPTLTGFKEKKEDNWKVFLFSQTDTPVFLPFSDGRASYLLLSQNSLAGNFILGGFARDHADQNWWSGKELTILNNTGSNVSLQNIAGLDELTQATFRANYVLKNNEAVKVKVLQDGDLLEVMAVSIDISGKLDKGTYTGTAQDLKNDIDNLSKTTDIVVATTTVGAINAGDIIPEGTTIQELTELLLNKTFYPTFVNPTFGLTNNAGLREVGSVFSVTLTFNFNRGQILGKLDNSIWNPTMLQDYRAGIATSYLLNGVSGSNNSSSFNVTTILGTNTLTGSVTYAIGVQPKDSKNNDFESPFPAGTSPIQSTSFEGIYPYFYYKSTSPITPEIMQSAIANGQATKVLASSTGTITIPFAANGEYIAVAYPASSTTKTIWYVNALDNGVIPGGLLGGVNTLPCNSPTNLWSNVNFKIHVSAGLITQLNPIQLKNS